MEKKYALTFPQQNIWLVDKLYNNSLVNLITGVINIKKEFNVEFCKKVINSIIKNNDSMRINILLENEEPYQIVTNYNVQEIIVKNMENQGESAINSYIDEFKKETIDIYSKNLYEFQILKYSKDSGAIILKMHHIISDAWSYSKIIEQFISNYTALENDGKIIDEKRPSYIEFVNSTEEYKTGEKYQKDEKFFEEYLKGINNEITLKDKSCKISNTSKRYNVKLDKSINDSILNYCKINRLSPYTLFLTALATYIYRIKDSNDFVIGSPSLNRANFKEKQMLGMFVATLPIRIKVEENIKFLDLAHNIASNTMNLFRHQKYPYTNILKKVRSENNNSNNLYSIVLSYQNARANYEHEGKYSTKWYPNDFQNEDLLIHILDMDSTGILEINYDYLSELFEDIEIQYLHTRLMAIIKNAVLDEKVDVENIEIMSEEEKNKILYEFNDTKCDYPTDKSVIDLFEEQVEKTPDNISLVFEDKKLTYKELNEKANAVAHYLIDEKNIKPGEIVGIEFKRSIDMIVSILAVAKTRAAYLPIDPEFPDDRIKYMMENSKSDVLLSNIQDIDYSKTENLNIKFNLNLPFYILYTSGSTGRPKGVVITTKNIINFAYGINKEVKIKKDDNVLSITTVSFDIFELELWLPIINGAKIVLANDEEKYNSFLLNELCKKNKVNVMQTTPSVYNSLLYEKENCQFLESIKKIILGGEKLSKVLVEKSKKFTNAQIYDGYGPTEATIYASMERIENSNEINVGKPASNTRILIKDKKSRMLPFGISGELCISGDCLSIGYLNNKEMTNKSFYDFENKIWYKTGDLAVINYSQKIVILDRIDLQVKINGQRLEIEEIEKQIYNTKKVTECVVVLNSNILTCIYVGDISDKDIIIKEVSKYLTPYMVPRQFYTIKELPKTANGKIDRKKIKSMQFDNVNNKVRLPKNSVQSKLCCFIRSLIKDNSNFGVDSNIFEFGIDSLDVMKLVVDIQKEYNVVINPKLVMDNPSVLEIEKIILDLKSSKLNTEKIESKNFTYELNSIQKAIYNDYLKNNKSILYTVPFEINCNNEVDAIKLKESIEQVICKHNILFSNIINCENKIIYTMQEKNNFNITIKECTENEYKQIKEKFVKPIELTSGKLFDIEMYKTEESLKILFNFSHIVVDGYSVCIILDEIEKKYNLELSDDEISVFKGFKKIKYSNEDREYYLQKFSDKVIDTKIINNNNNIKNCGDKYFKKLDSLDKIQKYCENQKITLNNFFLGVFTIVLYNLNINKNSDVILGISNIGRNFYTDKNAIGMFVKTIPYKIKVNNEIYLKDYFKEVNKVLLESINHSSYTYEDLINDLNINKKTLPFINIMYTFQDEGIHPIKLGKSYCNITELKTNTSKFDIGLEIILNNDNTINFNVEYANNYSKNEIEKLVQIIYRLITYIINNDIKKITVLNNYISNNFNKSFNYGYQELTKIKHEKVKKNIDAKSEKFRDLNEKNILFAYRKVLNDNNFSKYDNFFECGGDSLSIMRVLSILSSLNINVKYSDMFKYKTVKELYNHLYLDNNITKFGNDKYNYEKINYLLNNQNERSQHIIEKKNSNILLVGCTGFLGVNILRNCCLDNSIEKVYCIIRKKDNFSIEERFNKIIEFYFDSKTCYKILQKAILIDVNITEDNGIEKSLSEVDINTLDLVINAAARVKHFGNEDAFVEININAVKNLIKFCLEYDKKLIHISTISVSGNFIEESQIMQKNIASNTIFDENKLFINQDLSNIYVNTKFMAERLIYEAIINNKLNAKVFRVGNLTGDYINGKFQKNIEENAFVNRLRAFIYMKVIPENLKGLELEFTPVNFAADAILRIAKSSDVSNIVYHIYNPNHIKLEKIVELLSNIGIKIDIIPLSDSRKLFKQYIDSNLKLIDGIITDINEDYDITYVDNIKISCEKTIKTLNKLNFTWPCIDEKYFYIFFNYLKKINFFKLGGDA